MLEELTLNDLAKNVLLWTVIAVVIFAAVNTFSGRATKVEEIDYSQFLTAVESGGVSEVVFAGGNAITGKQGSNQPFVVYNPETDNTVLIGTLKKYNVKFKAAPPERQSILQMLFVQTFPFLILIGVWVYLMRQMQGGAGGRGAMSFGKSRARLLGEDQVQVTFADVAGVEEAKEEVFVRELRNLSKWRRLYAGGDPNWVYWDKKYYDLVINTYRHNQKESLRIVLEGIGYMRP